MVNNIKEHPDPQDRGDIPGIDVLSPVEGIAYFDRRARELIGLSGDAFLRRWDAEGFRPPPDAAEDRKLNRLVMLMPFAGRSLA